MLSAIDGHDKFGEDRIAALLAPWQLKSIRVGEELTAHGDRSRAWLIRDGDRQFVAKVTFDGPVYVEPGLRIAAVIAAGGIPTGPPVRTALGELCSPIPRAAGRVWTIALLSWVPGSPLDRARPGAAFAAGELLSRVHETLAQHPEVRPAGDLLPFYEGEARRLGPPVGGRLDAVVRAVQEASDNGFLECGVLYGDPSPEILQDPLTGELALIDWGTPSWGPLLFDLLTWERFFSDAPPNNRAAGELRSGYLSRSPARAAELFAVDMVTELIEAVRDTWIV